MDIHELDKKVAVVSTKVSNIERIVLKLESAVDSLNIKVAGTAATVAIFMIIAIKILGLS